MLSVGESFGKVTTESQLQAAFFRPYYVSRTPHESKHPNRGGAEGKRSWYAARLGGSSRIIQSAGRIIKPRGRRYSIRHMMILFNRGEAPSLSTPSGVGGSLGERIDKESIRGEWPRFF